jgi:uncharacterized protein YrrD
MPADAANNLLSIDSLIGKTILSLTSGNKIGEVSDLMIDPLRGLLLGLAVQPAHGGAHTAIIARDIHSLSEDAVMARSESSAINLQDASVPSFFLVRKNIIGAKIVTESGKLLGEVAVVYVDQAGSPATVIYEIRESLLDKLLRRAIFIPAAAGLAVADNAERIIVPDEAQREAADNLPELMNRLAEFKIGDSGTVFRGRPTAAMRAFRQGVIEISEAGEEAVLTKQPRVVEEINVHKEAQERFERVGETLRTSHVEVERFDGGTTSS